MRESNFAFPAQNKACVCITSQLYDRRALDTTSPLPLFNSLTHLTYLTSTSPRIREIMTMDGGLERLVRILHEFCLCPPPPENPATLYGLLAPNSRPQRLTPQLNPPAFDKHAAYRFSLAFQCVVNIGVRGSESIRSRVVQAGTLDVVGCILEAWLANKGFAVGPSTNTPGAPRETREQRQQRRLEQRQREDAAMLQRALQRQVDQVQQQRTIRPDDQSMDVSAADTSAILLLSDPSHPSDTDASTDNSIAATPQESGTPSGSVVFPGRDRSGTIIARPVWDQPQPPPSHGHAHASTSTTSAGRRRQRHRELPPESPGTSTDVSRPDTETEDDGDGYADVDMMDRSTGETTLDSEDGGVSASASTSPSPDRRPRNLNQHHRPPGAGRRAVGIVSDEQPEREGTVQTLPLPLGALGLETDAHIIISEAGETVVPDVAGVDVGRMGVEDGIVSLEPNDDFAMGAPPGAPGAVPTTTPITGIRSTMPRDHVENTPRPIPMDSISGTGSVQRRRNTSAIEAPDVTPRAALVGLPSTSAPSSSSAQAQIGHQRNATIRGRPAVGSLPTEAGPSTAPGPSSSPIRQHQHQEQQMQTTPTVTLNPHGPPSVAATATPTNPNPNPQVMTPLSVARAASSAHRDGDTSPYRDEDVLLSLQLLAYLSKYPHVRQAFYKPRVTFHPASVNLPGARFGVVGSGGTSGSGRKGKESVNGKGKEAASSAGTSVPGTGNGSGATGTPSAQRMTNVFSLVERFTFKPSSSETELPNPPPKLPPEIQYWAGVIMRNACRKDDSRGGIRQCANMLCGKWETFPREFAKCRRCRKAKYCGKDCQSTAWSEGHRFWCSARDGDDDKEKDKDKERDRERNSESASASASTTTRGGRDRDRERDRDRDRDGGIRVTTDHSTEGPVVIQQQGTQTRGERTERRHHQREQHHQDRDMATERNASTAPSPTTAGPRSGSASDARPRQQQFTRTPIGTLDGRYLARTIQRIPPGTVASPTRERDVEPFLASASTATAGTSPARGVDVGTSTSPGNGPPNVTIPYRARFSGPPPLVAEWETGIALGLRAHTGVPGRRLDGPGASRHRGDGPPGSDGDSIME